MYNIGCWTFSLPISKHKAQKWKICGTRVISSNHNLSSAEVSHSAWSLASLPNWLIVCLNTWLVLCAKMLCGLSCVLRQEERVCDGGDQRAISGVPTCANWDNPLCRICRMTWGAWEVCGTTLSPWRKNLCAECLGPEFETWDHDSCSSDYVTFNTEVLLQNNLIQFVGLHWQLNISTKLEVCCEWRYLAYICYMLANACMLCQKGD